MNAFIRNIGGSIGIAVISTFLTRLAQKHQSYMVAHATTTNPTFNAMVRGMSQGSSDAGRATRQAYARIYGMIVGQATTLAYVDIVTVLAGLVLCLIPFVFLMRRPPKAGGEVPPAH